MSQLLVLGGGPTDFTSGMIPASRIGELEYFEWNAGLSAWVVGSADYWVNNPGATGTILQQFGPPLVVSVNKDVKPGGWIEAPRENSFFIGGIGRFIPDSGILANLDTTKLTDETFDLTLAAPPLPLKAGDSVPSPADRSEVPHFKIYFEARKVLGAVPVGANNLDKIALSNTHFTYIRHLGDALDEVRVASTAASPPRTSPSSRGYACSPTARISPSTSCSRPTAYLLKESFVQLWSD